MSNCLMREFFPSKIRLKIKFKKYTLRRGNKYARKRVRIIEVVNVFHWSLTKALKKIKLTPL